MPNWTITATPALVAAMENRAGRVTDTGVRGPLSRTAVLSRIAERYEALTERVQVALSDQDLELILRSVPPLPFTVSTLVGLSALVEDHLRLKPAPGGEVDDLAQRLAQLSFPERIALADQLERRLLPRRDSSSWVSR